jgi:hypothetical protein
MHDRSLSKASRRGAPTHLWRRIGVIAGLSYVWATLLWILSGFPYARAVHGGAHLRTSYGILRWLEVTDGASRIHAGAATLTMLMCAALTALIVLYARRALRNLTPRWQCQNCGYNVSAGPPRSNLCPECGEPPNLQKNPWAFWR